VPLCSAVAQGGTTGATAFTGEQGNASVIHSALGIFRHPRSDFRISISSSVAVRGAFPLEDFSYNEYGFFIRFRMRIGLGFNKQHRE